MASSMCECGHPKMRHQAARVEGVGILRGFCEICNECDQFTPHERPFHEQPHIRTRTVKESKAAMQEFDANRPSWTRSRRSA